MADETGTTAGGESTLTVLVAMGANAGIGVLKLVAAIFTGSAAMYAEAAHSVADTATEGLLLTALRRSGRQPDREHPFGYGKERFFWALIAAVSILNVRGGVVKATFRTSRALNVAFTTTTSRASSRQATSGRSVGLIGRGRTSRPVR